MQCRASCQACLKSLKDNGMCVKVIRFDTKISDRDTIRWRKLCSPFFCVQDTKVKVSRLQG